jgi:peptide/nickel transport system substrate-binding protein
MQRIHRRSTVLATLSVAVLITVSACGGDDDDAGDGTVAATAADTADTETADTADTADTAAEGTSTVSDATDPAATDGEETDDTRPAAAGEVHVTEDEGDPVRGGDLVYGIEADTANAWAPFRASMATSGFIMASSVTDPLFATAPDGELAPMLVESWELSDDSVTWTYQIRDGITFTDGTPLDGAAVEFNLETCQYAPLTAGAWAGVDTIESSGQVVTITNKGPSVAVPRFTTERQCAYMYSPAWLGTLADVPQRKEGSPIYDAELAATPATGNPAAPIGLGAFVLESYTPGNGNSFKLVRNEDYWRGPNGITGEELPYLDSIEGAVAVDIDSRSNALRAGQFDVIHTSNADSIQQFLDDDAFEVTASSLFGATSYILLNVAEGEADPNGTNAASPLLNVHCRRALAYATDTQRVADERGAGLVQVANGPFGPGAIGYMEDTGYPTYDPDKASEEMDTCLAELGTDVAAFTFNTTNDPFNVETNSLIISMWEDALGDRVEATITPIEQGQYIGLALNGTFNAFGWSNHAGVDPDTQNYWWRSTDAKPVGSVALNFGRFKNPDIDAALDVIHSDPDPDTRRAAAEEINKIFGEEVYNLWLSWTLWGIVSQPYVNGVESNALPDGGEGVGLAYWGKHNTNQLWCDGGVCE